MAVALLAGAPNARRRVQLEVERYPYSAREQVSVHQGLPLELHHRHHQRFLHPLLPVRTNAPTSKRARKHTSLSSE